MHSKSRPDALSITGSKVPGTEIYGRNAWVTRGKKSIELNLKNPGAQEIIKKLVKEYDIVIEQNKPGTMDKMGLGYEDLKKENEKLIYCSISGYGQYGSLKTRAGHDINCLALSGLMGISGRKDVGPVLVGTQISDIPGAGYNVVISVLAAYIQRLRTGKGQFIDVSLLDTTVPFNLLSACDVLTTGVNEGRAEGKLTGGSAYDFYETKDGKYVAFGGIEPKFYQNFCNVLGVPEYGKYDLMAPNKDEIKAKFKEIIKTKTRDEWVKAFEGVEACFDPVLDLDEALNSQIFAEREMVIDAPLYGTDIKMKQIGYPVKFEGQKFEIPVTGYAPGFHTDEILKSLGYTDADIKKLEEDGAIR